MKSKNQSRVNNNNNNKLYGIKEIAKSANVSIATVDRVIHNRSGVSTKTRDKINAIIKKLDYKPNLLARRLASKKVFTLATLTPGVSKETAYWEVLLKGILQAEDEISQFGIKVEKYFFDQSDKASFVKQAGLLLKSKPDGVLLAPIFIEESIKFTQSCQQLNIPCVYINSDIPNQDSLCYIGPNLYHSGYLSAHLISYLVGKKDQILIVNISKEIENHHHILRKAEGFRAYFKEHDKPNLIITNDIRQTDYASVEKVIDSTLNANPGIKVIFVTNSRVATVAHYLEASGREDMLLVGYDFLPDNIEYLKRGVIDFLICQKPHEQSYRGMMTLYQYLVFSSTVEKVHFMPIDIITRENYLFYKN